MSGDENAKTIRGVGGADPLPAQDGRAQSTSFSSLFSLDDSSAASLDGDIPSGFDAPREGSFSLQGAEESINRSFETDCAVGTSSLDSLDWDLGDDYDAPSDFDQIMARRTPLMSDILPKSKADDSLPSTSALFGPNYRGAKGEERVNASPQLAAGDASASKADALPDVEPLSLTPRPYQTAGDKTLEGEFDDVVADDGGTEITQDVPAVASTPALDVVPVAVRAAQRESPVEREPALSGHEASSPVSRELGAVESLTEVAPTNSGTAEQGADPFEFIETDVPIAEPEVSSESRRVGSSVLVSGAQCTSVEIMPRMPETPHTTVRYDANTPIITAPVAAARRPTPQSQRVSPPAPSRLATRENAGVVRYVLAAVVIIGLIAGLRQALR